MITSEKKVSGASKALCALLGGKNAHERMLHRLHSAVLALHGIPIKTIANYFGDSPRAVAYWVKNFKSAGVRGVEEKVPPGRPSSLNPLRTTRLYEFIERRKEKGQKTNAEILSAHINKSFGVSLTTRQCWRILRKFREQTSKSGSISFRSTSF